jgi:hypothetical protein
LKRMPGYETALEQLKEDTQTDSSKETTKKFIK